MLQKLSNSFLTLLLSLKSEVLIQNRHPKLTKTYKCFTSNRRTVSNSLSEAWFRSVVATRCTNVILSASGAESLRILQQFCTRSTSLKASERANEVDVGLAIKANITLLEVQVVCICRTDLGGTPVTVDDDSAIHN